MYYCPTCEYDHRPEKGSMFCALNVLGARLDTLWMAMLADVPVLRHKPLTRIMQRRARRLAMMSEAERATVLGG